MDSYAYNDISVSTICGNLCVYVDAVFCNHQEIGRVVRIKNTWLAYSMEDFESPLSFPFVPDISAVGIDIASIAMKKRAIEYLVTKNRTKKENKEN